MSKMFWVFLFPFYHLPCHLVVVCIELSLLICPKYFNFLIWMMVNRCFFIFIFDKTSLFVSFSVHDIFSILLKARNSKCFYACLHYFGYGPCLSAIQVLTNRVLQDSFSRIQWHLCWFQNIFHFWEGGFGNSNSFLDLIYTSSIINNQC